MKIWEVMRKLHDNQKGTYRTKRDRSGYMEITIDEMNYYQLTVFDGDGKVSKFRNQFNGMVDTYKEWEKIKEPVTFEEVINSDKLCRVEHPFLIENEFDIKIFKTFDELMFGISNITNAHEMREIIKNGKWYLQE